MLPVLDSAALSCAHIWSASLEAQEVDCTPALSGTVSNAATGLRDSVAGLVGGGYSGTTGNDASAGSSNVKPSVEYEEDEVRP